MTDRSADKDVATLLGELGSDVGSLITKEMELARTELRAELSKGAKATASLSAAAVAGLLGMVFLSSAAAWGLAEVMAEGFAFLIVGGAYLVVAGFLAVVARRRITDIDPIPRQTLETLKEDAEWAKNVKKS